ncbi:phosphatase PAP2 family protein [Actinomadura soli]|uniref:Phosphatase PAP2 family protein n=1 Tax=Actinomadura soli TaxID=2508997 RepID=A0A5C4J090_9ACTN|nr:phosphatase PAP2 family protein [Actinomadura soli]TMQ89726.1 phosphatase PAP2 family protein [Actinomadura soli]
MGAPDFSAELYRDITGFAEGTPSWVHSAAEVGTDGGLLLFAALFVAGWWRARGRDARSMGLALAAPFAVVAAYLVSEVSKTFVGQERPCRAVAGAVHIAACPSPGDWSFPSNHATIAAASAAAIVVASRALAPLVLPLAALMAFSRVFVGVHYPHDVAAGFLVGVVVAPAAALVLVAVARRAVEALRGVAAGAALLGAGPAAAPSSLGPRAGVAVPATGVGAVPRGVPVPAGAGPVSRGGGLPEPPAAEVTMPDVMGGLTSRHGPLP